MCGFLNDNADKGQRRQIQQYLFSITCMDGMGNQGANLTLTAAPVRSAEYRNASLAPKHELSTAFGIACFCSAAIVKTQPMRPVQIGRIFLAKTRISVRFPAVEFERRRMENENAPATKADLIAVKGDLALSRQTSRPSRETSRPSRETSRLSRRTSRLSRETSRLSRETSRLSRQTSRPSMAGSMPLTRRWRCFAPRATTGMTT